MHNKHVIVSFFTKCASPVSESLNSSTVRPPACNPLPNVVIVRIHRCWAPLVGVVGGLQALRVVALVAPVEGKLAQAVLHHVAIGGS